MAINFEFSNQLYKALSRIVDVYKAQQDPVKFFYYKG
jgi:hypothetical protein